VTHGPVTDRELLQRLGPHPVGAFKIDELARTRARPRSCRQYETACAPAPGGRPNATTSDRPPVGVDGFECRTECAQPSKAALHLGYVAYPSHVTGEHV